MKSGCCQLKAFSLVILASLFVIILILSSSLNAAFQITGITTTASSEHASGLRGAVNLVNDSGMDPNDLHSNFFGDMWLTDAADFGANPRGGTVSGSYWIEFDLGQETVLTEMLIWNYNEANFPQMGMKTMTIEYSTTGSTDPADWTMIYNGSIPIANGGGQNPSALDLEVNFGGVSVRYVVITSANFPSHNYAPSTFGEVGLSEVRFFTLPQTCPEAVARGIQLASDLNGDCYVDMGDFALMTQIWMDCIDPIDASCQQPWAN